MNSPHFGVPQCCSCRHNALRNRIIGRSRFAASEECKRAESKAAKRCKKTDCAAKWRCTKRLAEHGEPTSDGLGCSFADVMPPLRMLLLGAVWQPLVVDCSGVVNSIRWEQRFANDYQELLTSRTLPNHYFENCVAKRHA